MQLPVGERPQPHFRISLILILSNLNKGDGTLGMLLSDDNLYMF